MCARVVCVSDVCVCLMCVSVCACRCNGSARFVTSKDWTVAISAAHGMGRKCDMRLACDIYTDAYAQVSTPLPQHVSAVKVPEQARETRHTTRKGYRATRAAELLVDSLRNEL